MSRIPLATQGPDRVFAIEREHASSDDSGIVAAML